MLPEQTTEVLQELAKKVQVLPFAVSRWFLDIQTFQKFPDILKGTLRLASTVLHSGSHRSFFENTKERESTNSLITVVFLPCWGFLISVVV